MVHSGVYPKVLEVDSEVLVKRGKVRVGDIYNTLPPGIELHEDERLDQVIAEMRRIDLTLEKHEYLIDKDQHERVMRGDEIIRKGVDKDRPKENEVSINDAVMMPHPSLKTFPDYVKKKRFDQKKVQQLEKVNLKRMIKNMNLKVSGENVIDERK